MSSQEIDPQKIQKSRSASSEDQYAAETQRQSIQVIKIKSDYFTQLINEQRQSRNCIEDMKKQIQSLKKRVKKCQKSLAKKQYYSTHEQNFEKEPNYIYLNRNDINQENVRKQIKKHLKKASKLSEDLYISFGNQSSRKIEEGRSPIGKRFVTSGSGEFTEGIYYNKDKASNTKTKKGNKKSHCVLHRHTKRDTSSKSSISSQSQKKQLIKLRNDFQKISKDSKRTQKYSNAKPINTESNTSILNRDRSLPKQIVRKMKELETLKSIYFKRK